MKSGFPKQMLQWPRDDRRVRDRVGMNLVWTQSAVALTAVDRKPSPIGRREVWFRIGPCDVASVVLLTSANAFSTMVRDEDILSAFAIAAVTFTARQPISGQG